MRLADQSTETGIVFSPLPTPPAIDLEDDHETDEEVRSRVHYSSSFTHRLPLNAPVFGFSNSEAQSLSQGETTSNYTSTTQTTTTSTSSQEAQSDNSVSQPPTSDSRESTDENVSSADIPMNEPGRSSERTDDIPEGVDPSFLEALPEDMRTEVSESFNTKLHMYIINKLIVLEKCNYLLPLGVFKIARYYVKFFFIDILYLPIRN